MNTYSIEKSIRLIANKFGFDIKRYRDQTSESGRIACMLRKKCIDLVIDIGANKGQYATMLRRQGYKGQIISFEPMLNAWNDLFKASCNDDLWDVFPRCAIGEKNGTASINVSANSVSSSILDMLKSHSDAAPESSYIGIESITMQTLDSAIESLTLNKRIFIKIDTQGYEDKVLQGSAKSLLRAVGIQIELSLTPLYADQILLPEMLDQLRAFGFDTWAIFPGFTDDSSGRMLQVDAVMFKNED